MKFFLLGPLLFLLACQDSDMQLFNTVDNAEVAEQAILAPLAGESPTPAEAGLPDKLALEGSPNNTVSLLYGTSASTGKQCMILQGTSLDLRTPDSVTRISTHKDCVLLDVDNNPSEPTK